MAASPHHEKGDLEKIGDTEDLSSGGGWRDAPPQPLFRPTDVAYTNVELFFSCSCKLTERLTVPKNSNSQIQTHDAVLENSRREALQLLVAYSFRTVLIA